ncbi:MAG: PaaI family thioesterase [Burkholderiales bacterium]
MNAPAFRPEPADPQFAARCRASFERQKAMALIGARMARVEPGRCEIELDWREDLTQQKGFLHGGIVGMIADTACGYAAYSLMPASASLVTVEYKINIVAPGRGERFVARAEVLKAGRTLSITRGEVYAGRGGVSTLCAVMQQTLMMLPDTPDTPE